MQRSSRGINTPENEKKLTQSSTNPMRTGLINFRNIFEGICRRIEGISFSRILANSAKYSSKVNKIRVLSSLFMRLQKEKRQNAFNRIKYKRVQYVITQKGASNLALALRRLYKNTMKSVIGRLKDVGHKEEKQSDGRHSSSSNVLSVSSDSLGASRSILESKSNQQAFQFNNEEATTFNIILSALRGKNYKDTRREIEYFLKKSKKEAFIAILREVLALIDQLDTVYEQAKGKNKLNIDLINNISQFDKLYRSEKPQQMQKIKNKCKAQSSSIEVIQIFESFINLYADNRRLKKKESASVEKEMKSAEKERQKRGIESQNEELKKAIKGLQMQLQQLTSDKGRLEESLKKIDRSKPSLPPRRPSSQKELTPIKTPKKNEDNETNNLEMQVFRLNKEIEQLTAKHQASFIALSAKHSALQLQYDSVIEEEKQLKAQVKEFQEGMKCYKVIQQKQSQKRIFNKEMNDFKRLFPESAFTRLFLLLSNEDTASANIQNILNMFTDNSWKRRTNFQLKEENPIAGQLNKITRILFDVHQQRDELASALQESQKREMALADERLKMEKSKSKVSSLKTGSSNEQYQQLKAQMQQITEDNQRLNQENNRLKNQLKTKTKLLESSKSKQNEDLVRINKQLLQETQKENERLALQHEKIENINKSLLKEIEQQRLTLEMIRGQVKTPEDNGKMSELEGRLISSEEKLANYKYLFQKTKKERDNLRLQLEEKNEEFELLKENEERYEIVKRANQLKIVELKHSYESNQLQIRKIQNEVERLLQQRQGILNERTVLEERLGVLVQLREKESSQMKETINTQQDANRKLQQHIEELTHHYEMDSKGWQQERTHIIRSIQNAQEEIARIKGKYEAELSEWKEKCERYTRQLTESRKDSTVERQILRQKISDFSRLTKCLPVMAIPSEDLQKQELRRQLQLANEQLTVLLRSKEGEKRQHRQQLQELVSASQLENAVHAQEKRILREEIQRARNEQYTINQQKIRKLREDILSLRNENERLTEIIDTNETNFDHLIAEHRQMRATMSYLQEENNRLGQAVSLADREKMELQEKLQGLEERLIEFQGKISYAMSEEGRHGNHHSIDHLQSHLKSIIEENEFLGQKNAQQARQLIQMQQQLIKLQAQLNSRQNEASKPANNEYCRYLEQKLKEEEGEQRRLREKQVQLMQRLEGQLQRVRELQLEKHLQRDNQLKIALAKADSTREISVLKDRLSMCESALRQRDNEIFQLKNTPQIQYPKQQQSKLMNYEEEIRFLQTQNKRLKAIADESGRIRHYFQEKSEEYQKLTLENKRLLQKIAMIQASSKQIEQKYLQTQSSVMKLQSQLQDSTFTRSWTEQEMNGSLSKPIREELGWMRQQLQAREEDIRQLRNRELQTSVTLKRNEELITQLSLKQERMQREICQLEDARARIRNFQELLRREKDLRSIQDQYSSQINELRQQTSFLRSQNEQLKNRNFKLQKRLESSSHFEQGFLFQIAKQLDENYSLQGEEEIQLRILHKISLEIGELISLNARLKEQCQRIEREKQSSIDLAQQGLNSSLRFMVNDLLQFLTRSQLINPEKLLFLPPGLQGEKLISEVGIILKDLFAGYAQDFEAASRNAELLREFKRVLEQFYESNNLSNFERLRKVLINLE